jgi:DNA mismatch endonuclease (patch repair protein)
MARIRKFGNEATEMRLVRLLRRDGVSGWRRHLTLPGRPDFTFRRERVVVFIDGCFWHGCPRCNWTPASNTTYWQEKLRRNKARDRQADRALRQAGWHVLRVWEHTLKRQPGRVLSRIRAALGRD